MIRAVLLDLDDTLLDNDMQQFLTHYFAALGRRTAQLVAPDQLVSALLASTRVMMNNHDPNITNQQAFDADFFSRLGYPESQVRPIFDFFYEEDFPALKRYTGVRPQARTLVQTLLERGYDVVIATNPMFPRRAIDHRLEWAGVIDFPFKLVTSYENSHFCKPNPSYYREILEKVGCHPQEAIMVGDDWGNDIEPAHQAGLHTYRLMDTAQDNTYPTLGFEGTLADCLAWVQSGGLSNL